MRPDRTFFLPPPRAFPGRRTKDASKDFTTSVQITLPDGSSLHGLTDADGKTLMTSDSRQARAARIEIALSGTRGDTGRIQAKIAETERHLALLKTHADIREAGK